MAQSCIFCNRSGLGLRNCIQILENLLHQKYWFSYLFVCSSGFPPLCQSLCKSLFVCKSPKVGNCRDWSQRNLTFWAKWVRILCDQSRLLTTFELGALFNTVYAVSYVLCLYVCQSLCTLETWERSHAQPRKLKSCDAPWSSADLSTAQLHWTLLLFQNIFLNDAFFEQPLVWHNFYPLDRNYPKRELELMFSL